MGSYGSNYGSNYGGAATVSEASSTKTVTAELCVTQSIKEDLCV